MWHLTILSHNHKFIVETWKETIDNMNKESTNVHQQVSEEDSGGDWPPG